MPNHVWILDSTWSASDLNARRQRFPSLQPPIDTQKQIHRHLLELAKKKQTLSMDDFLFIHHSDVIEIAGDIEFLLRKENVSLYSGASASANDGILPRSLVQRQLDDFLHYWGTGDKTSALEVLRQPDWIIDRIRRWTDRFQHDYINLLAPIDLLSVAFAAGELDEAKYRQIRAQLLTRLDQKQKKFLASNAQGLKNLSGVFEEVIKLSERSDPIAKGSPAPLDAEDKLRSLFAPRVLHVDDEIENGWDLVMPELLANYAFITEPEQVIPELDRLEENHTPYVVLLDLGLRSGDSPTPKAWRGLDLLREIRRKYPSAPVHVFSARNDMETYRQVMEAGGNGFIQKPCRSLSETSDHQIHARFRNQILSARYDIFRSFLYRAMKALRSQFSLDEVPHATSSASGAMPSKTIRIQNLDLAMGALLTTDFERTIRDRSYADTALRGLIVALYRPIEEEESARQSRQAPADQNWKVRILKAYRNLCAHFGRGDEIFHLDVRDLALISRLVVDPEILGTSLGRASNIVEQACEQIFHFLDLRALEHQWSEECRLGKTPRHPHLRNIRNQTPGQPAAKFSAEDRKLLALISDKIRNPKIEDSEIVVAFDGIRLSDRPTQAYRAPSIKGQTSQTAITPPEGTTPHRTSGSRQPTRWVKDLDHFVRQANGRRIIDFGKKFPGVEVDGKDPEQRNYFAWYYREHVANQLDRYTDKVLDFLKKTYGVGPGTGGSTLAPTGPVDSSAFAERKETNSVTTIPLSTSRPFEVALYEVTQDTAGNLVEGAIGAVERRYGKSLRDPFAKSRRVFFPEVMTSNGQRMLRGVEFRVRTSFASRRRYLQVMPTQTNASGSPDAFALMSYSDARQLISTAVEAIAWIQHHPAAQTDFSSYEPFERGGNRQALNAAYLRKALEGKRLSVVNETGGVGKGMSAQWQQVLEGHGFDLVSPNEADAVIVVVPENSPPDLLERVYRRWEKSGRPWKVVAPNPKNKDWNVLVALISRFGTEIAHSLILRPRDPNMLYLGLDLGHRANDKSQLAASLVNTNGQLLGWTLVDNPGEGTKRTAERIAFATFRTVFERLIPSIRDAVDPSQLRLVIHRDGSTLEQVDDYVEWLKSQYEIRCVDWLDIDKQRAPLFYLDAKQSTGQHIEFIDQNGQAEMWLRTTPGTIRNYAKPLCLVPQRNETDLETLAYEVFDLSYTLTQDYEMKNKLPATTYFADGFSSTGDKAVGFWGYEHLRRD